VGALSFRYGLKGSYFALVTLAFAEVFRIGALSLDVTGGGVGLMLPLREGAGQHAVRLAPGYALLALGFVVAAMLVTAWLRHSRFGARLQAVRDNEDAARAVGVDPFRIKLGAIVLSGAIMGAAGAFYVQVFQYIDPAIAFGPATSVEALVGAIVGGMGTLWGPVLGALVLHAAGRAHAQPVRPAAGPQHGHLRHGAGADRDLRAAFLPRGLIRTCGAARAQLRRGAPARSPGPGARDG
jgi:branched-chain amino acid transport system permease protein